MVILKCEQKYLWERFKYLKRSMIVNKEQILKSKRAEGFFPKNKTMIKSIRVQQSVRIVQLKVFEYNNR